MLSVLQRIYRILARCTSRLLAGLGWLTRIGVLLLLAYWSVGLLGRRNLTLALVGLIVLLLVILCLFRARAIHYRAWGVIGLGIGFAIATIPSWLLRHFPAQDFGSAAGQEARAIAELKRIQSVESRYYARFHRYGNLLEIKDEAGVYAWSESEAMVRPYRVQLRLSADRYRLIARASLERQPYSCWIGCPLFKDFYGDESGILRVDRHCRQANAQSARVD